MEKKYIIAVLLLIIVFASITLFIKAQGLKKAYQGDVQQALEQVRPVDNEILTVEDIKHLPMPVQKYLTYTGVIGKEKVQNMRVVTEGKFRPDPQKGLAPMVSEQYNFFAEPARFYYIKLKMSGVPVVGLHAYKDAKASMRIKLASLFKVADAQGEIMNKAETVTVFNDMCLLAPASLIDKRIKWETVDPLTVKAIFTNNGIAITAILYFNKKGELINFTSDDRYLTATGEEFRQARWSTPVKDYKDFNGVKLASYGEAVWNLPEGDYCYGQINIKEVDFN
ncbi:MAG: hypothetical protein VR67_04600 [Peptococcaceae bacterium BRH_c8a]|nr:MAG: hypothetical protein VR67_04600 [Peptococcaceae bacterium BRH_c8a]